jgi:hypothetical protein
MPENFQACPWPVLAFRTYILILLIWPIAALGLAERLANPIACCICRIENGCETMKLAEPRRTRALMAVAVGGYAPVLWTLTSGSAVAAVAMFIAQWIVSPLRSEPGSNGGRRERRRGLSAT